MAPIGTFVPQSGRRFYSIRDRPPIFAAARPVHPRSVDRRMTVLKRLTFFAYGVIAYVMILATFLYAIAFVGGFAVPTRLDADAAGPLVPSLAIDALLLTIFAVQHSVMARRWFKERWTQIVPWPIERSTFVVC